MPEPPLVYTGVVRPEWIDYNGHLNLAYYMLIFDQATDAFWDGFGLDAQYRADTGTSTYALESHVTYRRELLEGDSVNVTVRLLDFDRKRLHYLLRMYHAAEGYWSASNELLFVNVDVGQGRSTAFEPEMLERLTALHAEHREFPYPEEAGTMGIRRK